jgi:uncharacterized protein YkwD
VARFRFTLLLALSACCLSALFTGLAGAASRGGRRHAHGTTASSRERRHAHRPTACAKRSSYHAGKRHARRRHHGKRCPHPHSNKRHVTRGRHGRTHRRAHKPLRRSPAAAKSDSCPDANLTPTESNLESIRAATLCLVNRARADNGESPLQANSQLQQAAQSHSESMVDANYFEHVGPNGDTPLSRMRAAGYIYSSRVGYEVGENIGWGTLWLGTPNAIVTAWMASPGHRANILDAHFHDTAIGVSPHAPSSLGHGQGGAIYTQDFGVIVAG